MKPFWAGEALGREVDFFSKKECNADGDVFEVYYSDAQCTTETTPDGLPYSRNPMPKAEDGCYCDFSGVFADSCQWDCSACDSEGEGVQCMEDCSMETTYEACGFCYTYAPASFMDTTSAFYMGCMEILAGGGR